MLRTLSKTLTGGALALTLALTGMTATATPAAANGHRNNQGAEAAAIFGGLLLLYGLSQAGNNNSQVRRNGNHPLVLPQHPRPHQNFLVAPARCFEERNNHGIRYRGYGANCMQNHARAPHLLPPHCLQQFRTRNGLRRIYDGRCLFHAGWVRENGH